jgi:hypothetical protein
LVRIQEPITHDVVLDQDTEVIACILGSVIVEPPATVIVLGMITGEVRVARGAAVVVHGGIGGDVANAGGNLDVFGVVNGSVFEQGGGTRVHRGAVIYGDRI